MVNESIPRVRQNVKEKFGTIEKRIVVENQPVKISKYLNTIGVMYVQN